MNVENSRKLYQYKPWSSTTTYSTYVDHYVDTGNFTQSIYNRADNLHFDADVNNATMDGSAIAASIDYYTNQTSSKFVDFMITFSENAYLYYTPLLTVTGIIGNIVSVMVFFRTRLRKLSSSYYLSALCISDTGFLLVNFLLWLSLFNINIYNRNGCCQLFTFLSGFCSALSVWFVVAFTIERFIAVIYPLKRQTMCTVKRAKSVLIALIFVSAIHSLPLVALSAPAYTTTEPSTIVCEINKGYEVNCIPYLYYNFLSYLYFTFSLRYALRCSKINKWVRLHDRRYCVYRNQPKYMVTSVCSFLRISNLYT